MTARREASETQMVNQQLDPSDPDYQMRVARNGLLEEPNYSDDVSDQFNTAYHKGGGQTIEPVTKGFTPGLTGTEWPFNNAAALARGGTMEPNKSKTPPQPGGRTG